MNINDAFPDIYPLKMDGVDHPVIHVRDLEWTAVFKHTQAVVDSMALKDTDPTALLDATRKAYAELLCDAEGNAFGNFDQLHHKAAERLSDAVLMGVLRVGKYAEILVKSLPALMTTAADS